MGKAFSSECKHVYFLIFSILQKIGLQKLRTQVMLVMFLNSINSFKMKWSNALHLSIN